MSVDLSVELPGVSFIEGSTIDATVRATAEDDVTVEGGRAELVRTLSYRYTAWSPYASPITIPSSDSKVVSQAHFRPAGPLVAGRPFERPVTLDIPLLEDQGCAVLGLESLSSRRLVPGIPLSGILTVAPLRSTSARGIRLDLVLVEHVLHGPRVTDDPARNPAHEDKYADTVVASLPLAEHVQLDPSRPLRFEFTVPVPPQLPAPTIRMPNFSLSWMLRGVVDRQLHRDPCVAVELQAVTTPQ
jgi:hypothetical protein